jgi:hypothetical protein
MPLKNDKVLLHYVPHGINSELYRPIDENDKALKAQKKKLFGDKKYDFVVFYNSRNVQRKRTSNIILAFRTFCDNLTPEQADKCVLLMHTEKCLDAGTDLPAVKEAVCRKYNVVITDTKYSPDDMVLNYNIADVLINLSSNEGFGLSCAEATVCGTPTIISVTGGLQDQIGQTDDAGNPVQFGLNFGSNHTGKYKNHGVWSYPIYPVARYIQGSIPTPYIFDDIARWEDAADGMMYWYLIPKNQREKCGLKGRDWALTSGGITHKNMANQFIKGMDFVFQSFVPNKQVDVFTTDSYLGNVSPFDSFGGEVPVIDTEKLKNKIENTIKKLTYE